MSRARKDTGDWGEDLAASHLETLGLTILRRNVRTDAGTNTDQAIAKASRAWITTHGIGYKD